jgi:hypothetical protein
MGSVSIERVIEKFKLKNLTPQINVENIKIHQPDINRPVILSILRRRDPRSSGLWSFPTWKISRRSGRRKCIPG